MVFFWIVIALIFVLLLFFWLMINSFKIKPEKTEQTPQIYDIPFEEVWYKTKNGKRIYGWWMPDSSHAPTVILVHGWGKNIGRLMPYIRNLYGHGFNMLAFDSRNHGNSEKDDFSSMLKFAEDICAGIEFVAGKKQVVNPDVFLLGLSIGGAASIYSAARDQRIRKVITIGAPANPAKVMAYQLKKKRIPYFPFIWLLFEIIQLKIGIRFKKLAAESNINRSDADFLIVHGENDKVVPLEHARKILHSAKPGKARLWVVKDAGHSNCHYKSGFWEKVLGFLKQGKH